MPLAEHLLASDENKYTIDSVYNAISNRKEKPFKLKRAVPVYLYYFTTSVDKEDKLVFHQDIYGIDRKLTHLLIQKRNEFKKQM